MNGKNQERLNQIITKLRNTDHRLTPQRMEILKALVSSKEHPTAEDIYAQVGETFPMISLATVYKTINLLVDMGETVEIHRGSGKAHYDARDPNAHPHFICVKCDRTIDVELDVFDEISQAVKDETNFEILSHRLDFFGVCPDCQDD